MELCKLFTGNLEGGLYVLRMRCDEIKDGGPMESAQKFAPWRHFLGPNTLGKDCQSSSLKQYPLVLTGKLEFIKLLLSPRWHT